MSNGFILGATATNTGLPDATSLEAQILALASLRNSFRASPANWTASGTDVSALIQRKSGNADALSTASAKPQSVDNAIGGVFSALAFSGTQRMLFTPLPTLTGAFSYMTIFKAPASVASEMRIWGNRSSASQETWLGFSGTGSNVRLRHCNGTVDQACVLGDWNIAICSSDGTVAKLSVNGAVPVTVGHNNIPSPNGFALGAGNSSLQSPFTGQVKMWDRHDGVDLFADTTGLATINLYKALCRARYGMTVA